MRKKLVSNNFSDINNWLESYLLYPPLVVFQNQSTAEEFFCLLHNNLTAYISFSFIIVINEIRFFELLNSKI